MSVSMPPCEALVTEIPDCAFFRDILGRPFSQWATKIGADPNAPPESLPGEPKYVERRDQGFAILLNDACIGYCAQLFAEGREPNYRPYHGTLPHGLGFQLSRNEVRAILPAPIASHPGGGGVGLLGRPDRPWDVFRSVDFDIHVEYTLGASAIGLISLNAAGAWPNSHLNPKPN